MLAVFQFDAASIELIDRLIAEGRLPALAELRRRGRWERLAAETDLFEASIYPTIFSGIEVADHGLYYPFGWSAEEQRLRYMSSFGTPELVWERLDTAGARSLVIDPYQIWKDGMEHGVSFSGWGFQHRVIPSWGNPRSEWWRAVRKFGRPRLLVDVAGRRSQRDLLRMLDLFLEAPGRVAGLFTDLLARESFDLAWVSLISVHLGGHLLWDLSQLHGSGVSDDERARLEGGLADVYERADEALGRMVEALPSGADLVVLSPLGMGVNTTRSDLLPGMVENVLSGEKPAGVGPVGDPVWRVRARVPAFVRRAVNRALPGPQLREAVARTYMSGFDWNRARVFTLPGDHFGYVRLNVRGRERDGIVEPAEADALAEQLAAGLATFSDDDGAPSIARVHRPQLELHGRRAELLPDLVVRWSDHPSTRVTGVSSPSHGSVARRDVGVGRSGNHWPGAWVLTVPGASSELDLGRRPQITDLAATAMRLSGERSDLPGRSLLG